MLTRVLGVLSLRASSYREIADDTRATGQAFVVWLLGTLIAGFFADLLVTDAGGAVSTSVPRAIIGAVITLVFGLIGWAFSAWVLAFIAKIILHGKTNTLEMLRVTGFVHAFDIVAVLSALPLVSPALGIIAGLIQLVVAALRLIGYLIGVREAAEISTVSAVIAALIAAIVEFLIRVVLVVAVLGIVLVALGMSTAGP